jgi:hypothetical protein
MAHFSWSPGIGDPTVGGWLTVALYLLAAINCWSTARRLRPTSAHLLHERHAWLAISVLFLLLGINKQLDLQTALTEVGRMLAVSEGWYRDRQKVQIAFILVVAAVCASAAIVLLIWERHAPPPTWLGLLGTVLVLGFVLIRASSFHHIDRFIHARVFGFHWNWILEMGGISLTLIASIWRRRRDARSRKVRPA